MKKTLLYLLTILMFACGDPADEVIEEVENKNNGPEYMEYFTSNKWDLQPGINTYDVIIEFEGDSCIYVEGMTKKQFGRSGINFHGEYKYEGNKLVLIGEPNSYDITVSEVVKQERYKITITAEECDKSDCTGSYDVVPRN